MNTMYAPQNNSPHTELAGAVNSAETTLTVADGDILPDAPNVLTIGLGEDAELVLMQAKTGNILTVTRGFNGTTAKAWQAGDWMYRAITAQDVTAMQENIAGMLQAVYPVGSIYISANNVNPGTLFGGTWERFGNGRALVGVDEGDTDFDASGEEGGAKTHILTQAQLPTITGSIQAYSGNEGATAGGSGLFRSATGVFTGAGVRQYNGLPASSTTSWPGNTNYGIATLSVGSNQAHNNMQPYITCYFWKRTA